MIGSIRVEMNIRCMLDSTSLSSAESYCHIIHSIEIFFGRYSRALGRVIWWQIHILWLLSGYSNSFIPYFGIIKSFWTYKTEYITWWYFLQLSTWMNKCYKAIMQTIIEVNKNTIHVFLTNHNPNITWMILAISAMVVGLFNIHRVCC